MGEPERPGKNEVVSERDTDADPVHWLDLGPVPEMDGNRGHSRRWRWWSALVVAMVAGALLLARNQQAGQPAAPDRLAGGQASPASSGSALAGRPLPQAQPPRGAEAPGLPLPGAADAPALADASTVTTTDLGRALLDVPDDWELFGQGEGVVVRMELGRGRITRTSMPSLGNAKPVHFVVGQDRAIVRPKVWVPGYVVRDSQPATGLPPGLSQAASTLPGPDPWHLWAETRAGTGSALTLLTLDGRPAGVQIPIPQDATVQASDRAGNVLMSGVGGMYNARPDGMHRITSGTLLAVGPTRWLARECDERYQCAGVVIDRASGARRALKNPLDAYRQNAGAVSPDGRVAALLRPNGARGSNVRLLDLTSGENRLTSVMTRSHQSVAGQALVWSPDSRWLFVTDGDGRVLAINRAGKPVVLDAHPRPLDQLALRTAPR